MPKDEPDEFRVVLRKVVASCRLSYWEIKDQLGLGHGSLQRLLEGRWTSSITWSNSPVSSRSIPWSSWNSASRTSLPPPLTDWIRPNFRIRRNWQALSSTREDMADLVRGIVQEELGAWEDRPKGRSGLRVLATP